jgi:thiamine-phosphate pyrophosphorylase
MQHSISGLYLVAGEENCTKHSLPDVVEQAVAAGVKLVQLREKAADSRSFLQLAQQLMEVLEGTAARLIINDRADIALAAKAHGLHLGQRDLPFSIARQLLGPDAIIGLSVENDAQVAQAIMLQPDYIALSPIYPTPTKTDTAPAWGLEGLRRVRKSTDLPVVAIGGINARTLPKVAAAGADSFAIVSAICAAEQPGAAVKKLQSILVESR